MCHAVYFMPYNYLFQRVLIINKTAYHETQQKISHNVDYVIKENLSI